MAPSGSTISMKYIIFAAALIGTFQAVVWLILSLVSILIHESVIEVGDISGDMYGKRIYDLYLKRNFTDSQNEFIIYPKTFNYFMFIYLVLSFLWLIASCITLWAVIRGKWKFITKLMIIWSGITIAIAIIDIILMSLVAADLQKAHDLFNPSDPLTTPTSVTEVTDETSTPIKSSTTSFRTTTSSITPSRGSSTPTIIFSDTTLFSSTTPTTVSMYTTVSTYCPSTITTTHTPKTTTSTTISTDSTEFTQSPTTISSTTTFKTTTSTYTTESTYFSTKPTIFTTRTPKPITSSTVSTHTTESSYSPTTIFTTRTPKTTSSSIGPTPFIPIVPTRPQVFDVSTDASQNTEISTVDQDTSTIQYFQDRSMRVSKIASPTVDTQTTYISMGIIMSVAARGYILWIVNVTFAIMLIILVQRIWKMGRPTLLPPIDAYSTEPRPFNLYEQTEIGNGHLNNAFDFDESIIFSPRQMPDPRTDNTSQNPLSNSNRSSINNSQPPQTFNFPRPFEIARGPPPASKLAKIGKSGGGRRTPPLNISSPVLPSGNMPYIPDPDYSPPGSPNSQPKSVLKPRSNYIL